jgi:hypothetical protein
MYFQLAFALDRVKALAPQHPEWQTREPFASLLKDDLKRVLAGDDHALMEIVMASHAGMTTEEFDQIVRDWIATAKHQKTGRNYNEMVYQPMLELLAYLRANGFKTFIVSGGIEFMRPWVEKAYGIPPEQVVGNSIETKFECTMANRSSCACRRSTSLMIKKATRWHPEPHWAAPHRRLRQFRRWPPNAQMDHRRKPGTFRSHRPSRRRRA